MKFSIAGNSVLAEKLAEGFIEAGLTCALAVSFPDNKLPDGCLGLRTWSRHQDVEFVSATDLESESVAATLDQQQVEVLIASWPRMLSADFLRRFPVGVIGSHATALPAGRGRHPLHWTIAMGLDPASLTLFFMDPGEDSGEILGQSFVRVNQSTVIASLEARISEAGRLLSKSVGSLLLHSERNGIPQGSNLATRWRRRTAFDTEIDFRMSVTAITHLVNSYSDPYPCAKVMSHLGTVPIRKATIPPTVRPNWRQMTPGTVLTVNNDYIEVRADDGVIGLIADTRTAGLPPVGTQLLPPAFYHEARLSCGIDHDDVVTG